MNTQALAIQEQRVVAQPVDLSVIMRAAQDPNVNVEKVGQLIALFERMQDRQAKQEFDDALRLAQARMPRVTMDGHLINQATGAVQSRFAKIENIDKFLRPILTEFGFSVTTSIIGTELAKTPVIRKGADAVVIESTLYVAEGILRKGGHKEHFYTRLALDTSGNKNLTQGMGSTQKYARRQLLMMMFNVITVGEDTDANPVEYVTGEQVNQILDYCSHLGKKTESLVLTALQVGSLEQIPRSRFAESIGWLKGIEEALAKKRADARGQE